MRIQLEDRMKTKTVAAVGQPLLDIIVPCDKSLLEKNNVLAGTHGFATTAELHNLLGQVAFSAASLSPGGSALNSISSAKLLGLEGTFIGLTGDDQFGQLVRAQIEARGVKLPLAPTPEGPTGLCVSLITPNGERTMRTNLGAASLLNITHLNDIQLHHNEWVIFEGYFLVGSPENHSVLVETSAFLKDKKAKVVFALGSEHVALTQREEILKSILPATYLLVSNEREACALTATSRVEDALSALEKMVPGAIVTCGERGSWTYMDGERFFTPAYTKGTPVIDTTGAGDVYLGTFLAGLSMGHSPRHAALGAARISALVVSQLGANLPKEAKEIWDQAVSR